MKNDSTRDTAPVGFPGCLGKALGETEATARLARSSEAFASLVAYRDMMAEVDASELAQPGSCRGLEPLLEERAWAFEAATRVLAADALQAVNDLRDSGELGSVMSRAAEYMASHEGDVGGKLKEAEEQILRAVPGIDKRVLAEAIEIASAREMSVAPRGDGIEVGMIGVTGERASETFMASPGAGSAGRVGVREFFASDRRIVSALSPTIAMGADCHRAGRRDLLLEVDRDLYASFVGGLASMRETSYRHARRLAEIGHSGFRAKDPITAIVVGAIAVGAILVAIGVIVLATGGDVNLGIFLIGAGIIFIAGGICVAVGACAFVLAILVPVVA